jgi:hypothetical protein
MILMHELCECTCPHIKHRAQCVSVLVCPGDCGWQQSGAQGAERHCRMERAHHQSVDGQQVRRHGRLPLCNVQRWAQNGSPACPPNKWRPSLLHQNRPPSPGHARFAVCRFCAIWKHSLLDCYQEDSCRFSTLCLNSPGTAHLFWADFR